MTKNMTEGNPLKIILLFSVPVLLGNIFQQFYNMVDTIIVGRYLGEDALAAVGSTGCLMFLVLGFANGVAQGFGVMISHSYGAKDYKLLKHYVALSLILTAIVSTILTLITVLGSRQLLIWMNTPENILDLANDYIQVIFAGIILTMAYNVASGILRGIGDSKTPLYFLILSSFLNIFLDIFLIVTIPLGTAGAAYATIISQGISAVLCFIYMFRKFDILKIKREDVYIDRVGVINLLSVGVPMALNYSVTAVGTMIFQSAVNVFGSSVVAAYTAASKVWNLATQPMPTLGTAMATYCAQNLGAGKVNRIFAGMKYAFFLCIAVSALAVGISVFGGRFIVSWFISNPTEEIFTYAMQYLYIASCFALPLAWIFAYRNALQGLNQGFVPMISGVVELVSRYAIVLLFAEPFGYEGVCYADPAAWVTTGILLIITYFSWKHKLQKKLGQA
ncbi:MAG: MATE family efflux transporter [Roseburia sp.]|nr:MATE family efflux transporter [Roseburia sp.]